MTSLRRANLIAHETSHMWFGDLVTMKWFDDVWLKEVFANFMAAKIVNPTFPDINHELRFFLQHYPSAYDVDRTAGANPIRQPLDNLKDAGSLYGPIIYLKAPIVMRQLEQILGPDELRDGLREYLSRFAFRNATWTDLIAILDARTDEDLAAWSRAWVDEPGRPTIATNLETANGKMSRLTFTQSDPRGRSLRWNAAAAGRARIRAWRAHHDGEDGRALGRSAAGRRSARCRTTSWRTAKGPATACSRSTTASRQFFLTITGRDRRRPDARHRVGHAVGRHARGRRSRRGRCSISRCARCPASAKN